MHLSGLDLCLWLTSLLLNAALVAVLVLRKRAFAFPMFTALISMNVVRTVTLFLVFRHAGSRGYYYTYLPFAAADVLLQIAVAFEIALHVFRPAGRWSPGTKQAFVIVSAGALTAACVVSWLALPATRWLADTLLIRGNFLSAALMSELFVGMLVLSVRDGLPWKTHVSSIALGFGAYSLICVVIEALHTYFGLRSGTEAYRIVSKWRIGAYEAVVIFWIVTLFRDAPAEREMPLVLQQRLGVLQSHLGSLRTALGRRGAK